MAKTQIYGEQTNMTDGLSLPGSGALNFTGNTLAQINNYRGTDLELVNRSGGAITLYVGTGTQALKVDSNGNAGLGTTPKGSSGGFRFLEVSASTVMVQDNSGSIYYGKNWYYTGTYKYKTSGNNAFLYVQDGGGHSWHIAPVGSADAAIAWTQAMTVDVNGNLLVGVTSGSCNTIAKAVGEGSLVFAVQATAGAFAYFFGAASGGGNAANTALILNKHSTTSRSINAAGTVNASGADYAEYMTKAEACGQLAKGAIVGIDVDGRLTDKWAAAVSFLIKSTDPSYVGGDVWGSEAALGMARPVEPVLELPAYDGPAEPGDEPAAPIAPADDAEPEAIAAYAAALEDYQEAQQLHAARLAAYAQGQAEHEATIQALRTEFDTVTMPPYQVEKARFEALLEQARQRVDRMAYCGQVPVNVQGGKPGQYVVPIAAGDGIAGQLVDAAAVTFDQYRRAVGVVQNILPDGRANVRVKPV
jgi:hypothetical protein